MSFVRMLTIANERAIEQKNNEFFSQGFATAEAKVDHFGKRWMDVWQFQVKESRTKVELLTYFWPKTERKSRADCSTINDKKDNDRTGIQNE